MDDRQKAILIQNMVNNLPALRKRLDLTQADLAAKIGIGRSSLTSIENKKRPMTWNMFLSLVFIFTKNAETDKLLNAMEIYTDELNDFIQASE